MWGAVMDSPSVKLEIVGVGLSPLVRQQGL